ncbi:MAG: CNNM domain-containing protein [Halobacteriaceae archaeon]
MVALSAFFSSSETAIFTLPAEWAPEGDGRAAVLASLRRNPHRLHVTILVGNNVVNVAIASISTGILVRYLPAGEAIPVATVVASFVVLVFGEIVSKSYGLGNAERWSLVVAGPIRVVERLLYPLVVVFDLVTRRVTALLGGATDIEDPYLD